MNLLYAPAARGGSANANEHNVFAGFDVQILETLAACAIAHDKAAKILYLPPPQKIMSLAA